MLVYAFTGDIKELKKNGWTFQKLYASKYKSYWNSLTEHGRRIYMFVVNKMVLELSNIDGKYQKTYIDYLLKYDYETLRQNYIMSNAGNVMSLQEFKKGCRDEYLNPLLDADKKREDGLITDAEFQSLTGDLYESEFSCSIPFSKELHKMVNDLNNIHPLTVIYV